MLTSYADLALILSSGYTFQTSLYGLALDNLVSFDIVLPTGEIKTVTSGDEDLFFAVRVSAPSHAPVSLSNIDALGYFQQLWDCHQLHLQDASSDGGLRRSD